MEKFTLKKHQTTTLSSSGGGGGTNFSDLEEDIVVEIICRLNIKHMISCKCVSRSWYSLISGVCIPRITTLSPVYGLLFSTDPRPPAQTYGPWEFSFVTSKHTSLDLRQSCLGSTIPFRPSPDNFLDCHDGLLLFFDARSLYRRYYVCNPSTQQFTDIPNWPGNEIPTAAALTSDPNFSLVHIPNSRRWIDIFSSATWMWYRYELDMTPYIRRSQWASRYIYLDGSVYRLSLAGYLLEFGVRRIGFQDIKLPHTISVENYPIGSSGVSQGSLHYSWFDKSNLKINVWMLKPGRRCPTNERWHLKHSICFKYLLDQYPLLPRCPHYFKHFSVFSYHPTSDVLFIGDCCGIFCYDPEMKTLETIFRIDESGKQKAILDGQNRVYPFSVNLTPLDVAWQKGYVFPLKKKPRKLNEVRKGITFDHADCWRLFT